MNFCPYFPHMLSYVAKFGVRDPHVMLFRMCKFHENWQMESCFFFVCVCVCVCKWNYIYVHTMKLGDIIKVENAW